MQKITNLDDLNNDNIKINDTINTYNNFFQDIHSINSIPYIYINGNLIKGLEQEINRESHKDLIELYKKDMSLHKNDIQKLPELMWQTISEDKLWPLAVSLIQYKNILIAYYSYFNNNIINNAKQIAKFLNCRLFITNDSLTQLTRLAKKRKKYIILKRVY